MCGSKSRSCSSIAKARWQGLAPGHCGFCVPCLIRRASITSAFGTDPTHYTLADLTARLIDAEVKRIMSDAHGDARRILNDKRDLLEQVTRRLLDIEVMEGDELRAMLGVREATPRASEGSEKTPLPPGIH